MDARGHAWAFRIGRIRACAKLESWKSSTRVMRARRRWIGSSGKEEEFLVAYQEREERQKASGQQGEKPGKRQKQEEALREMDEILGPLNEQVGQGGPVSAAASSSAPVEIVEESGAVGGEAENMEVERMARDEPQHSMDIGALHRFE